MTLFIKNLNTYLSEMKIKQTFLSLITGLEKNKLSRILSGTQDESGSDMECIAKALGKKVEYFLSDNFVVTKIDDCSVNKIAFYAGEPSEKQQETANLLMELMENIDEILSAESRFTNISID